MSYHTSGSMGRMNGYGTIKIFLQNTSGLTQGQEYPYTIQGQPQEHTATADRVEGQTVLVDSNYTIGENPPPFSAGRPLTVYVPNQSFPLVTSLITKIEVHNDLIAEYTNSHGRVDIIPLIEHLLTVHYSILVCVL